MSQTATSASPPLHSAIWTIWSKRLRSTVKTKREWSDCAITPIFQLTTQSEVEILMRDFEFEPNSRFIFMRGYIRPIWEDSDHIGAGYISIPCTKSSFQKLLKDLLQGLFSSQIVRTNRQNSLDIYGLSYTCNFRTKAIRLWCKPSTPTNVIPIYFFTKKFKKIFSNDKPITHIQFEPFDTM